VHPLRHHRGAPTGLNCRVRITPRDKESARGARQSPISGAHSDQLPDSPHHDAIPATYRKRSASSEPSRATTRASARTRSRRGRRRT
jgi:hypothetical protein